MPEERTLTPVEEDRQVDRAIVLLLLDHESQRPWSEEEIERVSRPPSVERSSGRRTPPLSSAV